MGLGPRRRPAAAVQKARGRSRLPESPSTENPTCARVAPVCHPIGLFHPMCAPRGACDAPWHHRAPSAPQIRQVVRAPCRIRNVAAFNRDSFACEQPAWRRAPAHATDPHRLSAGRAYTELPRALVPSVVRWCVMGLPSTHHRSPRHTQRHDEANATGPEPLEPRAG